MKDIAPRRRLTDDDRNACLKLITCGLSCQEIADIMKSSRSAVAFIKQTYNACLSKDFDTLRDKAREMGAKTRFSATEAGQAFEYMSMAGWKTGDMLDGIEGIMNLAAASGEDLATTSDIVTDSLYKSP